MTWYLLIKGDPFVAAAEISLRGIVLSHLRARTDGQTEIWCAERYEPQIKAWFFDGSDSAQMFKDHAAGAPDGSVMAYRAVSAPMETQ